MILPNPSAIILLSLLFGSSMSVLYIGAESYLLSVTQPVYAVYSGVAAGLGIWFFLRYLQNTKIKFAHYASAGTTIYLSTLASLGTTFYTPLGRAVLWFFLSIFGIRFFKWLISEIALKHLDPVRAQSHFSFLITTFEGGMLVPLLILKLSKANPSPYQMIEASFLLCFSGLVLLLFQFGPKRNFEIRFSRKTEALPFFDKQDLFKALALSFGLLSLCFGAFKVCEEYLIKIVLKENLVSFAAIRDMLTNYRLIGNALIIGVGLMLGAIIRRRHLSPIMILFIQTLLLIVGGCVCLTTGAFYSFVAFEVARWVGEHCLFFLPSQMVFSGFVEPYRHRLRSIQSLFYYPMAGIPLLFLFSFTQWKIPSWQKEFLLWFILALLILGLLLLARFKSLLVKTLYAFVSSKHKPAAIHAIGLLSFLRPKGYEGRMSDLLRASPKKLLRKNIILSLGYSKDVRALNTIIQEFDSDQEEIQIAVEDALKVAPRYKAVQFLNRIILGQLKTKSARVRINAASVIAGMYGKESIPFLLSGLEDRDERVVANILETLGFFREKELIPYFEDYLHSPIPRVRANALMGLARFRRTRRVYRNIMRNMLNGDDPRMIASALYAVGKLKDGFFRNELEKIANSSALQERAVKRCLAWAWFRVKDPRGLGLLSELLCAPQEEKEEILESLLHFFSQFDPGLRMDVIRHLTISRRDNPEALANIERKLKHPVYDFHLELDYFYWLISGEQKNLKKT